MTAEQRAGLMTPEDPGKSEQKKGSRDRFATQSTEIPGVSLRIEPGVEVDILKQTIKEFFETARIFASNKFQLDRIAVQQTSMDKEIKTTAEAHNGLRGVQSEADNFKLTVIPKVHVDYNLPLVKESAGPAYSSIVHEDVIVTISVPVGVQTKKGPADSEKLQQALTNALVRLGFEETDLPKFVNVEVVGRVDEKRLIEMEEKKQITLV